MWNEELVSDMVARNLANAPRHAMNRLDKLFAAGCIDPRQDNKTILETVKHYKRLKDSEWAFDDIVAGLKATSGPVDVPDLATLEPISY